jgi:hypothetical protein
MNIFPLPFMYCSNLSCKFSRQTQKKLVGFSHYGHFSNFSSNVRISRELSIRSNENYVVSSMITTTVVLLEIWTLVFSEISTRVDQNLVHCKTYLDFNYYQLLDWAVVFNYISYPHKHVNLIPPGWCTFDNLLQMLMKSSSVQRDQKHIY